MNKYETEGAEAAKAGKGFDACPYLFARTGRDFDREKLDRWFAGWSRNAKPLLPNRKGPSQRRPGVHRRERSRDCRNWLALIGQDDDYR